MSVRMSMSGDNESVHPNPIEALRWNDERQRWEWDSTVLYAEVNDAMQERLRAVYATLAQMAGEVATLRQAVEQLRQQKAPESHFPIEHAVSIRHIPVTCPGCHFERERNEWPMR